MAKLGKSDLTSKFLDLKSFAGEIFSRIREKSFDPIFNSNDELYSQSKVIEMSKGCDGILTSLTDRMDQETINKLFFIKRIMFI